MIDKTLFEDFAAVIDASDAAGRNVVITLDADNTITLEGVRLNSLDMNDFLFV